MPESITMLKFNSAVSQKDMEGKTNFVANTAMHLKSHPIPAIRPVCNPHLLMAKDLVQLGKYLQDEKYRFTTVTPSTHCLVNTRPSSGVTSTLEGIFGWNRPFLLTSLPATIAESALSAGLICSEGDLYRSLVRYSTLGDNLYAHGGFPTTAADAIFFGPDTCRFVNALNRHIRPCKLLVDVRCGSGAGGLQVAHLAQKTVLTDINPKALLFAEANAQLAGYPNVELRSSDVLANVEGHPDTIIANPPYLVDPLERVYRHGGADLGTALSVRIATEAMQRLAPGGRLVLYTGAPIVAGVDQLAAAILPMVREAAADFSYTEVDPDVFGEELGTIPYMQVERIAAVVLCANMADVR